MSEDSEIKKNKKLNNSEWRTIDRLWTKAYCKADFIGLVAHEMLESYQVDDWLDGKRHSGDHPQRRIFH